jgi:ubiquinone/menaquinone biosynthesis C-methylase UbiE
MNSYVKNYLKAIDHPLPLMKYTFEQEMELIGLYAAHTPLSGRVADLGCGAGRPIIDLAEMFPYKRFTGIDNDSHMLKIAKSRARSRVSNITFMQENFLETTIRNGDMGCVYSTYNSIGHLNDIEKESLIKEKSRIACLNSPIITITWNRDKQTTEFLEEYYSYIGLRAIYSTDTGTVTDKGSFDRVDPQHISALYKKFCIETKEIRDIGAFVAVIGIQGPKR